MEPRFQLLNNGQEVQKDDFDLLGKVSGLADDRVFAELLRLAPFDGSNVAKAILPYGSSASGTTATVEAGTGAVTVHPFRALVGARTAEATSAIDCWRDIRSAIFVGTNMGGGESLTWSQTLTANASGSPRWDLVYAAVAVDANAASVSRYRKNPSTKVVSASSVVTQLVTTVTVGVVTGTPAATPSFPALPSDAAGVYYIPLAYVRVVNGFTGASVLNAKDINEVAPVVTLHHQGAVRPADGNVDGAGVSTSSSTSQKWTGTTATQPKMYLQPSMAGGESLLVAIDLTDASSANWSHQDGAILDASRDWRRRLFRWQALVSTSSGGTPAWTTTSIGCPQGGQPHDLNTDDGGVSMTLGFGASFQTTTPPSTPADPAIVQLTSGTNVPNTVMTAATAVSLRVDHSTGKLKLKVTGAPACWLLVWLDATAPRA